MNRIVRATMGCVVVGACALVAACGGAGGSSRASTAEATPAREAKPGVSASATRGDPVQSVVEWTYNSKVGKHIRTANYNIYTTQERPVLLARLPGFVEAALRNYTTALGPLPDPPGAMETFVMSTRGDWERLTRQLMGADAEVYLRIPRGGYAAGGRGVYYDIGTSDTLAIAGHEGWHQYTQRTFRQPLPTWLEEGVATFMEGHRWDGGTPRFLAWSNTERFDQLRSAASAGKLIPLEELISLSPQDLLMAGGEVGSSSRVGAGGRGVGGTAEAGPNDRLLTYYAQLWALVHFLNEGENGKYAEGLRRLLADAASGALRERLAKAIGERGARSSMLMRRGPTAITAYFNADVEQFASEYERFVERVVAVRSRGRIVSGRSPLE